MSDIDQKLLEVQLKLFKRKADRAHINAFFKNAKLDGSITVKK
jgi:hypothetical protein